MASILSITNLFDKEQKRKNRWVLDFEEIPNLDPTITPVQANKNIVLSLFSAQRPNFSIGETEFHRLNEKYYYPAGKAEYQPLEVQFYDTIGLNAGKHIYNWMKAVYDPETGAVGYKSSLTAQANFLSLGPKGETVEHWKLVNMWPKDINFNEVSYDSTDAMMVTVSFRYDLAVAFFEADIRPTALSADSTLGFANTGTFGGGGTFDPPSAEAFAPLVTAAEAAAEFPKNDIIQGFFST